MNNMEKEYAAGAVIFRKHKEDILFLVVYSARNEIWGFPKGHVHKGESETETAIREIEEETSITTLRFIGDFREEAVYEKTANRGRDKGRRIEKHSIYFLCETTETKAASNTDEISECRWAGIEDARNLIVFEGSKEILEKAYRFIKES